MAYTKLGGRTTKYSVSGSSTPNSRNDIRAWGDVYYEQTSTDLDNRRSKVKLIAGVQAYSSTSTAYAEFKLDAKIYKKVNDTWQTIGSNSASFSGNYTNGARVESIVITDKIVPHDTDGTAQVRISVSITNVLVGSGYSGSNQSFAYTYDLPSIGELASINSVDVEEQNQVLINYGITNNTYVNGLSKKQYTIYVDNPNQTPISKYEIINGTINSKINYVESQTNQLILDFENSNNIYYESIDSQNRPVIIAKLDFTTGGSIYTYVNYDINTYIDYHTPQFVPTSTTTKRNGQLSGKVTLNASGTYYNGSIGSLNQGGTYKPTIKYKIWEINTAEPTTYAYTISSSNITTSNGTFNVSNYEIGSTDPSATNYFDYNKSYNVKLQVSDTLKSNEYIANVTQGIAIWTEYKDRVDFRKITITDTTTGETTTEISTEGITTNKIIAQNIQGGTDTITNSASGTAITFDTPFDTAPNVVLTPITTASGNITIKIIEITATGFRAFNSTSSSVDACWIAIGN